MEDNFLHFLKNLPDSDWGKKVDKKWTVKDIVAHLVGWEKECAIQLSVISKTQKRPWFLKTDDYDKFNQKSIEEYKVYSPHELLTEWQKWQNIIEDEIHKIGEDKLKAKPELFSWLFEEDEDFSESGEGHYIEHFKQIKNALKM